MLLAALLQIDPEAFGHAIESAAVYTENLRGPGSAASHCLQHMNHVTPLQFIKRGQVLEHRLSLVLWLDGARLLPNLCRQVLAGYHISPRV